jgi:hypothetical protein
MAVVMKVARIIRRSLSGDRIEAATAVWAAAGHAPERQHGAPGGAVLGDGFGCVLRTGGDEAARRKPTDARRLVEAYREEQCSGGQAHLSPDLLASCIASVTRLLNSWNETFRTPGSTLMR